MGCVYVDLLREFFGRLRAADITTTHLNDYRAARQKDGISNTTINRELSALRRGYHIRMKQDPPLVVRIPNFRFIPENNIRQGFFEWDAFKTLREALPDHLKVEATIGYYTGMRLREILGLKWDQVDWTHGLIRLEPGTTRQSRSFNSLSLNIF